MGITLDKRKDIIGDKVIIEGGSDGTSIGNTGDRLHVDAGVTSAVATLADVIAMTRSLGLQDGESYDKIIFSQSGSDYFLEYILSEIAQFNILITYTSATDWVLQKLTPTGFLLQENGDKLLQEDGFALLAEGKIPA